MAQQHRGMKTRRLIVQTAAEVFCERGYDGTSTTEILTRSQLTRGALYFHFDSKQQLAEAVASVPAEVFVPPDGPVALQCLVDFSLRHAERLATDVVLRASMRLSAEHGTGCAQGAAPHEAKLRAVLLRMLQQADRAGELVPGADPVEVTDVLMGFFTNVQPYWAKTTAGLTHRLATLWRYLLPSIATAELLPRLRLHPGRAPQPAGCGEGTAPAMSGSMS
ncbi:gamma-butyrolactone receptor protein [Streptomyces noursei ZPM]|uniref:Gamma-butyrolactone-binding protein n=2 Tax=Streptomyces noursei TaxID=1971 RepID=A0A059W6A3_STRNR|nr:gamma-butyrolactone receptor protein [Streptomyces noursei]AKA06897.1 gamma-butyrolactone receptor protein [Streptomyces noursei ZPM]EXU91995.1 gamma-butyrolactone receptor protein [Streptomyces noursei PD-1]GCB94750.1 gamma-butyrolactone-binding protein [Streptomyces noursei]